LEEFIHAGTPTSRARRATARKATVRDEALGTARATRRRLASAVHADREPDRAGGVRKSGPVQRANKACKLHDVRTPLSLQVGLGQIDAGHLPGGVRREAGEFARGTRSHGISGAAILPEEKQRDETPMARFEFTDHPGGGVQMHIAAETPRELFRACGSALCLYVRDVALVEPRNTYPVVIDAYNEKTACLTLINELLVRMETSALAFSRFECTQLEERQAAKGRRQVRVHGRALGEPADARRHPMLRPVRCARLEGLRLKRTPSGLELCCVLDA